MGANPTRQGVAPAGSNRSGSGGNDQPKGPVNTQGHTYTTAPLLDSTVFSHRWPRPIPADWVERVNKPETEAELEAIRRCIARGQPFGGDKWHQRVAKAMNLGYTLRRPGRPRKMPEEKA